MTPAPEPTIYDIVAPQFVVLPEVTSVLLSILYCAIGLLLLTLLWRRLTRFNPVNNIIAELRRTDYSPDQLVMLATRAVFIATGENIAAMSGKELNEFVLRYPEFTATAEFLRTRFAPTAVADNTQVYNELRKSLEQRSSK